MKCAVFSGDCVVSQIDYANRTATVTWTPSPYNGSYGIIFGVGNDNSYTSTRSSIQWQGELGENPVAEEVEVTRYYGVLNENRRYGSIRAHAVEVNATDDYRIEVTSASFDPYIALRRNSVTLSDSNSSPSIIERELDPTSRYSLYIGTNPLREFDLLYGRYVNELSSDFGIGDGLYEIRVFRKIGDPIEVTTDNLANFVTDLRVESGSANGAFIPGVGPIPMKIIATVFANSETYEVDVSADEYGASIVSQNSDLVEPVGNGFLQPTGVGDTSVDITLGSISINVPVSIIEQTDDPVSLLALSKPQVLYAGASKGLIWLKIDSDAPLSIVEMSWESTDFDYLETYYHNSSQYFFEAG